MKKVAVFGLGRVGKLVALMLADEGFDVVVSIRFPLHLFRYLSSK